MGISARIVDGTEIRVTRYDQYGMGLSEVMVNGQLALAGTQLTGRMSGIALDGHGKTE